MIQITNKENIQNLCRTFYDSLRELFVELIASVGRVFFSELKHAAITVCPKFPIDHLSELFALSAIPRQSSSFFYLLVNNILAKIWHDYYERVKLFHEDLMDITINIWVRPVSLSFKMIYLRFNDVFKIFKSS